VRIEDFIARHVPALEADEARHNLIIGVLARAAASSAAGLKYWSVGPPGACAIQSPGYPVLLGQLSEPQCHQLAGWLRDTDFPGVVGLDDSALWFAARAEHLGIRFAERIPQQILTIEKTPRYPSATGTARPVTIADAARFAEWLAAFSAEATPHDPPLPRKAVEERAGSGNYLFWEVDGQPVSLGGITRRTPHGVAIASVYTPPMLRNRGYAGSVVAALVEGSYAAGKSFACLYVDLRNPASRRCYEKIGFAPLCDSWHVVRANSPH
jgi:RimJ/RimL family protein N-acetyltransferase